MKISFLILIVTLVNSFISHPLCSSCVFIRYEGRYVINNWKTERNYKEKKSREKEKKTVEYLYEYYTTSKLDIKAEKCCSIFSLVVFYNY